MKFYFSLIALLCSTVCFAQIEGFVSDANENEVLPFTHVYNLTSSEGAYTDINGFYRINAALGDRLQFSYVGYLKQIITVGNASQINIKLSPDGYILGDLLIRPGTNPAHRIINNAIAQRTKNNPDNMKSYSCMVYNKLIADFSLDSTKISPDIYAKSVRDTGSHLILNEALVTREYKYKGNISEHVIASRTSGFNEYQQMALIPSMIQFFHFYNDVLEWKAPVKFFLNPVSPGSTSKYFFLLRDTIVSGVDSTFIISYQPRRSANFEGLKGLLYINSNGWAIQSVVAEPADYSLISLKLQQQYALVDSVWFPSELSLELFFNNIANKGINGVYRGKSRIFDIIFEPDLSDRTFKSHNMTIDDNAHLNTELIERYRDTKLTAREDSTYKRYRSGLFDNMMQVMEGVADNLALSVGIFDFPFDKIVKQNYFEGFRLGVGIFTNRHLSSWFSVGGYYGYGINDKRNKYGVSFSLFPEKHLDSEVKFWWANDAYELSLSNEAGISARKLLGKFQIETVFTERDFQPAFEYSYRGNDLSQKWERNAEIGFKLRYAHNEERTRLFRRSLQVFTTKPVLYFNFYYAIPECFGSKYKYLKAEAGVERRWYIRNFGTTNFSIWAGWMDADTPLPLTFTVTNMEQSAFLTEGAKWRSSFHALTGDLYASNRYFNAFVYHDFGTLLCKTRSKVFRPRVAVAQSFGWSQLNHPERHSSGEVNISDMSRNYFETGLVIEDIIRTKPFNMFFLGLGGGIYGAYGGSVEKSFVKTLTPKIRISTSF